jgi:hypothetical protein
MAIRQEKMLKLLMAAYERAATRLNPEEPWPDDLRARDIVRLLREQSREVAEKAPTKPRH